jgi:hypothetical protein
MKETLHHASRLTELLQHDIARIAKDGNAEQQRLAAICADNRLQLANCLWRIQSIPPVKTIGDEIDLLISETSSPEARERYEASARAGDFNPGDINEIDDNTWFARQMAKHENAHAAYRRKVNRVAWLLAATAVGVVLAVVKILTDLF